MLNEEEVNLDLKEVPESNEDDSSDYNNKYYQTFKIDNVDNNINLPTIIAGEAPESDEEYELYVNQTSSTKPSIKCENIKNENARIYTDEIKFQSNSVKKSREKNRTFYCNINSFKKHILNSTNHELNSINEQLLKSQIELQQTLNNIRIVRANLHDFNQKLNSIIAADYIPKINIKVQSIFNII